MSWFTDNGLTDPTIDPTLGGLIDPTTGQYLGNPPTTTQPVTPPGGNPTTGPMIPSTLATPPAPATTTGGGAPAVTNPNDPAQITAWLQWQASQPGADPILKTPGGVQYYLQAIQSNGGLTDTNYWANKSTLASAGGAVGGPSSGGGFGSLGTGTYPGGQFTAPGANLGSLPSWAQPYGGTFTAPSTSVGSLPSWAQPYGKTYTLPTAEDAAKTPGYQFALSQGIQGIDRGAAARGNLQTGGTLKAEQAYGTGLADQTYQNTVANSLNAFGTNYGVFSGDQSRASGAYQNAFGNALAGFNTNANTYYNNANLASSAYQNQFNNALNAYGTNFNVWNTVGNNQFNRYNTLAQYGLSQ